jgi:phosphoglycolate phosphatase
VLLLWDIDGTILLRASAAHRDALHAAIRAVFGVDEPERPRVEVAGRTDGDIAREILLRCGVPADRIDERGGELRAVACREFARRCPSDLSDLLAPGIGGLLAELAAAPGVRQALVTGNLEPIARLKVERAGIGRCFEAGQGAFGSDHESRAALPGLARARAGLDGRPHPREHTVVIGDTPRDIACARADGLRCLAVTTGPFGAQDLADADGVARSAGELRDLLRELGAGPTAG